MAYPSFAISLASLLAALVFIVLLARRRKFSRPAGALLGLAIALALWSFGESATRLLPVSANYDIVLAWIRVEWLGIAFVSATLLHFVVEYIRSPIADRRWFLPATYAPAVLVAGLILFTDTIVEGWAASPLGPFAELGPWYLPAAAWFAFLLAGANVLLIVAYVRGDAVFRKRLLPLLAVMTTTNFLGLLTETFWPFLTGAPTGLGLGTLFALAFTVTGVYSEWRLHFLPITAIIEKSSVERPVHRLEQGLSHLFLSPHRDPAFEAFRELVGSLPGLCITAVYPQRIQERYGLEKTPILWVTNLAPRGLVARPTGLEFEVQLSTVRFMKENRGTVVIVDDLDFLTFTNGFEAVSRFLRRLANQAISHGSTLLASADPEAFTRGQLAMLRGMFDRVREFAPPAARGGRASIEGPGALLLEGPSTEALEVYRSLAKAEEGLIVTTKNPQRIRRLYGTTSPVVWVSEKPEEGLSEKPLSVDLDAAKLAVARLGDQLHPLMYAPDLEQLSVVAPFPKALEFIKGLIDNMALRDGIFVASVEPQALPPNQLAALRRRFDRIRALA